MTSLYESQETELGATTEEVIMNFKEYQEYKAACEHVIATGEKAAKLATNPEFITIVMEEYLTKEPARLGGLMASGRLNPKQFDECVEDLRGISNLRTFLGSFIQKANIAKNELEELEQARQQAVEAGIVLK